VNAKLSMEHADWHTPVAIVDLARRVLGRFDLDPMSSAEANAVIQATEFYDEDQDGLYEHTAEGRVFRCWNGRIFLNPAGGAAREAWKVLLTNYRLGNTREAIWVGYSLEQLQSLQGQSYEQLEGDTHPLCFPTCVPRKRLAFVESEARRLSRMALERSRGRRPAERAASPTHGNYITYLGPNVELFRDVFSAIGVVR
jgi:hypothetical protein